MKKNVVLAIAVIYIIAVVAVGVFGISVRITDPIIYVEKVECVSDGYKSYEGNPDKLAMGYDGYIMRAYSEGLEVVIHCTITPLEATNKDLEYIYDENSSTYDVFVNENDGTATVKFKRSGTAIITINAADGKGAGLRVEIIAPNIF